MTKASLRRQQLREEQAAAELDAQSHPRQQQTDGIFQDQSTPHQQSPPRMDPPPPYDAPYRRTSDHESNHSQHEDSGCLSVGPGKTQGCLVVNTGSRGLDFVVRGCLNVDSDDGCLNFESSGGCLNYRSDDGCMNYEVSTGGGCLNYQATGGGCLNYRSARGGCMQFETR